MTSANISPDTLDYYAKIQDLMNLVSGRENELALAKVETLLAEYPDRSEPYHFLAILSLLLKDRGRALEMAEKAHQLAPTVRDHADLLANIYARVNKQAEGLYYAKLATTLEPHEFFPTLLPDEIGSYFDALAQATPSYHYPNALRFFNLQRIEECASQCEMELRLNASHHQAHALLGRCFLLLSDPLRARMALHSAIHFAPDIATYRLYLGECLAHMGLYEQALTSFAEAIERDKTSLNIRQNVLAAMRYFPAPYRSQLDQQLVVVADAGRDVYRMDTPPSDHLDGKIRIGFLGSQFEQPEEYPFFYPFLARHDETKFEVHVFYNSANTNNTLKHLQTLTDSWVGIVDVDDDTVMAMIQGNGIDVLIDLDGAFINRRGAILTCGPAPIMLNWPTGHPLTGMPKVSHFNDVIKDRDDMDFWPITREPLATMEAPTGLPAFERGFITFGATADLAHLTPKTLAVWADLLHKIPTAQILLANHHPISADTATYISDLFGDHGIGGRVSFHRHVSGDPAIRYGADYYGEIDVLLDTAPVSDAELITEALWMGVPVFTMDDPDNDHVGAHVLGQAGKPQWIAASSKQFQEIVLGLTIDLGRLSQTRKSLREEMQASKLFSPKQAICDFEKLITDLMKAHSAQ